ncbi:MAG: transporter, partial [Hyphomonadaceae bacterium]
AHSVSFTLPDVETRRTQVWLVGFGESALNFELVVWPSLEAVKRPGSMMAAYCWAIDDALRKHGIEIPFPQRDVRVRSWFGREGDAGVDAWRGAPEPAPPPAPQASRGPSVNDAAREIDPKNEP